MRQFTTQCFENSDKVKRDILTTLHTVIRNLVISSHIRPVRYFASSNGI